MPVHSVPLPLLAWAYVRTAYSILLSDDTVCWVSIALAYTPFKGRTNSSSSNFERLRVLECSNVEATPNTLPARFSPAFRWHSSAAASGAWSVTSATETTLFPGASLVERQRTLVKFLFVEGPDSCLGFRARGHLNKSKSFGAVCNAVTDHGDRFHLPVGTESLLQLLFGDIIS